MLIKDQLKVKYNLIDMDEYLLNNNQTGLESGSDGKIKTVLYSEENIEFLQQRDIKVFTDLIKVNKNNYNTAKTKMCLV